MRSEDDHQRYQGGGSMAKIIGVLTGGGDVPGLNPCIKALVYRAIDEGYEVLGIRRGWGGLLEFNSKDPASFSEHFMPLDKQAVRTIDRSGGTVLHTSRTNPSKVKLNDEPAFLRDSQHAKAAEADPGPRDFTPHVLRVLGD